jgi:hypothetical protein
MAVTTERWVPHHYLLFAICYSTSLRRVDVLFRLECASDEADLRVRLCHDLDDIEAKRDIRKIEQTQPFFSGANDSTPFAPSDCATWRSEHFVSARLYFDEHKHLFLSIAAHQIDFTAASRPEIAIEDFEGFFFEKPFSGRLAFPA